jgi:outer membrane usher protein
LLCAVPFFALLTAPGQVLAEEDGGLSSIEGLFKTAPEQPPDGALVLDVTLNGVPMGPMNFVASGQELSVPLDTVRALRLKPAATGVLQVTRLAPETYKLDRAGGTVAITAPADAFELITLTPFGAQTAQRLSPETGGLYLNYDVNARHARSTTASHDGYGGFASVHAFAPDFVANSGWSYDTDGRSGPVRLDTTLTWRPVERELALSIGDLTSAPGTIARPFRFSGLTFGTDHSAEPLWSPVPLQSVTGTAQPTSSIDLYVNGLRAAQMLTPGGPFTIVLPQGSFTGNSHLIVTDITGRVVDIPLSTPHFNLNLLKRGLSLWSVGVGAPRFNWGAESNTWLTQPFGYGSVQRGLRDDLTAALHVEAGAGFWQGEAELRALVTNGLGLRVAASASRSEFGSGKYVSGGVILSLPANVSMDISGSAAAGHFDDAISVSGARFDLRHGIPNAYSQPLQQSAAVRVTWEPRDRLSLSGEYNRLRYRSSPATRFAALTASTSLGARSSLYVTASRDYSASSGTSVTVGLSALFGSGVNGSVSAGRDGNESAEQLSLARSLGQSRGDVGWQLSTQKGAYGNYLSGEAQLRSGSGIPALGFSKFGDQTQAYLRAAGSVGVVAGHRFVGDPIDGGVIIADVGEAGVPLLINGYEATRTGRDGQGLVPASVAGAPQRVEISTEHLSLSLIPTTTRQIVTVRQGSGTVAEFTMRSADHGAVVVLSIDGITPPAGTSVRLGGIEIPVDLEGRAWLPEIDLDATLDVDLPDGRHCVVATGFDGHGGPGVVLGPFACRTDL